jgi:hypothetical protein
VRTPAGPSAASELGQLGAWRRDPHPARTEIDDQDGVILDADDPAEAVLIVCHLVLHGELLGWRGEGRSAEGTCGQEGPGSGAGVFHYDQYAPIGVVEAGMILGLTAAGVSEADATAAVFIQRLFSSYLPPIWGWATLIWMRKREYL